MASAENLYDAVVIGGGPAGLTAALYLGRARYRTLVVECDRFGGQITVTSEVVNYPGVLTSTGEGLTHVMRKQAENFGAEFKIARVTSLNMDGDIKVVHTDKGDIECLSVLLATGASPRHIGFDGEEDYQGRGIAYCATCDGELFTDKEVLVIGGGYQAAEESVFLTKYAKKVTIIMRKDDFSCAASVAQAAWKHPKIEVFPNTVIKRVSGDTVLRAAVLEDTLTKGRETWRPENPEETFGIFVLAGRTPAIELVADLAELDESGYVLTDTNQMTTCDGLFAAGDVCQKLLRQVATAVGQAAEATAGMERYIRDAQAKTGLVPQANPIVKPDLDKSISAATAADTSVAQQKAQTGTLFTADMIAQMNDAFANLNRPLVLRLSLNDLPFSSEMKAYMEAIAEHSDKISIEIVDNPAGSDLPKTEVYFEDGTWTRFAYHGVPAKHEFEPFVTALSVVSSSAKDTDATEKTQIYSLQGPLDIQIVAGQTCPRCGNLIVAATHIAALRQDVTLHVYDVAHAPELQAQYDILSVPCFIVNDGQLVKSGNVARTVSELLEVLQAK